MKKAITPVIVFSVSVLFGLPFLAGCNSLVEGAIYLSLLGDDYGKMKATLPPIPQGKGRVFVYFKDSGKTIANTARITDYCHIDSKRYGLMGASFFYDDLNPGDHKLVTASARDPLSFTLAEGKPIFLRVSLAGDAKMMRKNNEYTYAIVDQAVAESEMNDIPYFKTATRG